MSASGDAAQRIWREIYDFSLSPDAIVNTRRPWHSTSFITGIHAELGQRSARMARAARRETFREVMRLLEGPAAERWSRFRGHCTDAWPGGRLSQKRSSWVGALLQRLLRRSLRAACSTRPHGLLLVVHLDAFFPCRPRPAISGAHRRPIAKRITSSATSSESGCVRG